MSMRERIARLVFDWTDYPHCVEVSSEDWDWCMVHQPGRIASAFAFADAVLAVLPLPSAEVIAAIDFAADGIGLDLEDPDTLPAYRVLAERHSAVLRAYLAALEDAE